MEDAYLLEERHMSDGPRASESLRQFLTSRKRPIVAARRSPEPSLERLVHTKARSMSSASISAIAAAGTG